MSMQSLGRVGTQCLACCTQRTIRSTNVVAKVQRSSQMMRPFYSASSLQLPRQRTGSSRRPLNEQRASLEADAGGADIEDALTGFADQDRLPHEKKAAKPAAKWIEEPSSFQPNKVPTEEHIVEVKEAHEPGEWVSRPVHAGGMEEEAQSDTPWYLQVQSENQPSPDINPLLERQKVPDLPSNPPPLLQPLLDHISITLGLDSLSLIDLRHLDPPAALGANLLMLVGTARSEKHLHVSADRLCRWLRSEHKMRPYADGLLGRNELKLKMKRKNRRSKTLAAAGLQGWNGRSGLEKEVDDGIRTGWVCVHLGRVQPGAVEDTDAQETSAASEASSEPTAPAFIGFGETEDHVTIVVQMFTEQKRDETDLEGLWTDISERGFRKQKHREAMEIEAERLLEQGMTAPGVSASYMPPHLPRRLERAYAA